MEGKTLWCPNECSLCPHGQREYANVDRGSTVSAIKPYEGFSDVDHTIKELMSF
jgi:hypothetical protein